MARYIGEVDAHEFLHLRSPDPEPVKLAETRDKWLHDFDQWSEAEHQEVLSDQAAVSRGSMTPELSVSKQRIRQTKAMRAAEGLAIRKEEAGPARAERLEVREQLAHALAVTRPHEGVAVNCSTARALVPGAVQRSIEKFDSASEGDRFIADLPGKGELMMIPFLVSAVASAPRKIVTQATAGTVTTSNISMTTAGITYARFQVLGLRVRTTYGATAAATIPYAYVTLKTAKVDGGDPLLYGNQTELIDLASAIAGYCDLFIPSLRSNPRMQENQIAKITLTAGVNAATKKGQLMVTADLICRKIG